MWYDRVPTVVEIAQETAEYSTTWLACMLVHEAYHCELWHRWTQSEDCWESTEEEKACSREALRVARLLGAPESERTFFEQDDGSHLKHVEQLPHYRTVEEILRARQVSRRTGVIASVVQQIKSLFRYVFFGRI